MDDHGRPKRTVPFSADRSRRFGIYGIEHALSTKMACHPASGEEHAVPWDTSTELWGLSGPNGMWLPYRRKREGPELPGYDWVQRPPQAWDILGRQNLDDGFIARLETSRRAYIVEHGRHHPSPADSQSMPRAA